MCEQALYNLKTDIGETPPVNWSPTGTIKAQPLGKPIAKEGTLFEQLSVKKTGIDFQITWDKPAKFDRVFYAQNTGGGVAVGDVDGDGRPDLFFTSPSGGCRLFRNLGEFRFQDVTSESGLNLAEHWGTGATLVDIDNDDDVDLYLCGYDCPNRLFLNKGDGTFTDASLKSGLAYRGASVMMSFADYDRDGDLDAYLLTAGLAPKPHQKFRVRFEGDRPVIPDDLKEYWQLI